MRNVYMDNAATTNVYQEVVEAMLPYFGENYGNASAIYSMGVNNKVAINRARKIIADKINAKPEYIYFTSGGSEADNWVLKSVADKFGSGNIITSSIEHKAILNTCKWLEKHGFTVTYIEPDERGAINPKDVQKAIRPDTILVSIMMANNEIGTIEPIVNIGRICKSNNILFHTDAVQAFCHIPIDVKELGVNFLSASAHKIHGPKGVGFLYANVELEPLIHGGGQESGIRAGTENVPGIVGFAKAVELAPKDIETFDENLCALRDYMLDELFEIGGTSLNGSLLFRLPNNLNITFNGIDGSVMLSLLDMYGIQASTGSACNSSDIKPSHVLKAIGLTDKEANSSIRFTLDDHVTKEDIDYVIDSVKEAVAQLRG